MVPTVKVTLINCATHQAYNVTFCDDKQASDWLEAKRSTHAIEITEGTEADPNWDHFPLTIGTLFPLCEHGLLLQRCWGPGHYGPED